MSECDLHILLRVKNARKRLNKKCADDGSVGTSKLNARIIILEDISLAPNVTDCTDKFLGLDAQLPSDEDLDNPYFAGWLLRRGVFWRVLEKDIEGVPLVRFAILKGVKLELQPGLVPHFPQLLSQLTALLCGQALSKMFQIQVLLFQSQQCCTLFLLFA